MQGVNELSHSKNSPDAEIRPLFLHAKYHCWFLVKFSHEIHFKVYFNTEISVGCLCSCWLAVIHLRIDCFNDSSWTSSCCAEDHSMPNSHLNNHIFIAIELIHLRLKNTLLHNKAYNTNSHTLSSIQSRLNTHTSWFPEFAQMM